MLKIYNYDITFQEVPTETSLVLNISNCPYRCKGCHSPILWEDKGLPILDVLNGLLVNYKDLITCVCFMGGDQNSEELIKAIAIIKDKGLKTCLYTGEDNFDNLKEILPYLDYVKYGSYKEELGGLQSPNTNQRFLKRTSGEWVDWNYKFQKHK